MFDISFDFIFTKCAKYFSAPINSCLIIIIYLKYYLSKCLPRKEAWLFILLKRVGGGCQKGGGAWCDTRLWFECACVVFVEGKRNTRCEIRTSKLS